MSSQQINDIEKYMYQLSNCNINKYIIEWENLIKENADLRLIINGKLRSCEYDYIDKMILRGLSKYDEIQLYRFIIELMNKRDTSIYGSIVFEFRINEMIKSGDIFITKKEIKKDVIGEEREVEYISAKCR